MNSQKVWMEEEKLDELIIVGCFKGDLTLKDLLCNVALLFVWLFG